MDRNRGIHEGMTVWSSDGERLGKIVACDDRSFEIEKGFFFPKEYIATYDEVSELRGDGDVLLARTKDELEHGYGRGHNVPLRKDTAGAVGGGTVATTTAASAKMGTAKEAGYAKDTGFAKDEIRVPLAEEQLRAEKHMEEVGKVRVTKDVITEQQQITVPVQKEVVRVERIPAGPEALAGEPSFERSTQEIPIREERVDIYKDSVVREELRVRKDMVEGRDTESGTIRREVAHVETTGDVERGEALGGMAERGNLESEKLGGERTGGISPPMDSGDLSKRK
jgi:uncharacterized protein (TIGR02271 family)